MAAGTTATIFEAKAMVSGAHRCPHCDSGFPSEQDMRQHAESEHLNQEFSCKLCGKIFPWLRSLSKHMRSHTEDESSAVFFQSSTRNIFKF